MKYPGATASTSQVHINNMYIIYTFVCLSGLLVCRILGAVALPVASPLTIVALGIRLRANSGFLFRHGNWLAALTSLLFTLLVFLETSVLIDHKHLMFLLDLHFCSFKN